VEVSFPLSLADLRALGVTLTTAEALAVAQSLFESRADDARPPFGPLSAGNILLNADGLVTSDACAATPTVLEAAILLEELLPDRHPQVPGALRYTLGRALHEVAAPPFDSLADFSRALRRFEQGDRAAMVRGVYLRATTPAAIPGSLWQSAGLPFAATVLAGVALIGAGETMHVSRSARPVGAVSASLDAKPIVFDPPPMIAAAPHVVLASSGAATLRRQATARPDTQPARRSGFFSRVLSRVRIKVDEL
jgi:hypothetical protein